MDISLWTFDFIENLELVKSAFREPIQSLAEVVLGVKEKAPDWIVKSPVS